MRRWADAGAKMLAAGVAIPINCDHSDRARDVVGYVKDFKLDGHRLLALCQFIGDDAALTAARNLVSVGIDPNFIDGEARQWGEAIVHLALTPVPVVPNQGEFLQASLASDQDDVLILADGAPAEAGEEANVTIVCSAELFEALADLIPGEQDVTLADCIARVVQHLQSLEASPTDREIANSLQAELSAAQQRVAELSARAAAPLSEEAAAAMVEAAIVRFDAAVACGGLSPAARDRLVAALVKSPDGRANLLALSRAANSRGERALALTVADILLDNQAIELGEKTSLQAMARPIPGQEGSPIEQLRQYMTKIASVSG